MKGSDLGSKIIRFNLKGLFTLTYFFFGNGLPKHGFGLGSRSQADAGLRAGASANFGLEIISIFSSFVSDL